MATVNAGIKEVFLLPAATTVTNVSTMEIGLGFRQTGQLIGEPFNLIEDFRTRQFPNLYNFRAEFGTMQVACATIRKLIEYARTSGCGSAIFTTGIVKVSPSVGASGANLGNLFVFDVGNSLGIDWELLLTPTERMINITLERAFGQADAEALMLASASKLIGFNPPTDKLPKLDPSLVSTGFLHPTPFSSTGGYVIPPIQLADFRVSFATKGNKNAFNTSLVTSIHMEVEGTISQVDSAKLREAMYMSASSFLPAADLSITIDGANAIVVKGLSYSKSGTFEVGDENRTAKVKYQGDLDLDFADIVTGSGVIFNTYLL